MRHLRQRVSVASAAALVLAVLAVPGAAAPAATRTSSVALTAPAQFNLTLAAVGFDTGAGRPLRLRLRQGPGLYFVAAALVRRPVAGGPRALVLAINRRPRGSLAPDRRSIGLRVTAARALGAAVLRQAANPLPRPVGGGGAPPAICGPAGPRRALAAGDLRALLGAGLPLPGFGAAASVAQAFDLVCGLPSDPAFARAVSGCGSSLVAGCCPPNALCAVPVTPPPAPSPTPAPMPPPVCPPPCPRPPPCGPLVACPLGAARALAAIACPLPALAC
jgi:hypothetical protein